MSSLQPREEINHWTIFVFGFRSTKSLPLLLYIHHIHQRSMGWGKNSRCFCPRISRPPGGRIRKYLEIKDIYWGCLNCYWHRKSKEHQHRQDSSDIIVFVFFLFIASLTVTVQISCESVLAQNNKLHPEREFGTRGKMKTLTFRFLIKR